MKDILSKALAHAPATLSWLVYLLFYLFFAAVVFAPIYMIDIPGVFNLIAPFAAFLILMFLPLIWPIVEALLWLASVPFALHYRLCPFLVYYLICAAIYLVFSFFPSIFRLIRIHSKSK